MSFSGTKGISPRQWQQLVDTLRESRNPYEREAVYFGVVAADGSPILVDRRQFREHVHFLGSTGGGKSSMGLAPLIEQLISFGDSTVIVIDLKGDSNELLAAASCARTHLEVRRGVRLPMKHFTLEQGQPTCSFNPLASEVWLRLTALQRTDVLSAASGLIYGSDYGRAFYTAANAAVVYAASQMINGERNFRSLHRDVASLLHGQGGVDLPRELRQAGVHVYEVLTRFAGIEQLNLKPDASSELNFADCFRTPQIVYMKFPASVSQLTSAAVARLATYFLMTAANGVKDRCQVYLVIDEFQRMASESLGILFEQARSLDVSLILSNQSIEDIGKNSSSLLNLVETNCNTRQWFSLSSIADLKRVETIGSTRERMQVTTSHSRTPKGTVRTEAFRKEEVSRISVNDATYISNDPNLSILRLTGVRHGYSQYRGLPFIAQSQFHITEEEYRERRAYQWPELGPDMVRACETPPPPLTDSFVVPMKTKSPAAVQKAPTAKKSPSTDKPTRVPKSPSNSGIEFSDWTPDGF